MFDLNNQKEFYKSGTTRSFEFRREQLRKLSALLSEHETELLSALETDFSKSHFEGFITEIGVLQYEIKHTLKHLKQWMRPKKVGTNLINFPASSYILPEPLGSTLIIGAWNYPYLLSLGPVIGAMAAGNTIVLKPSELASNCSKTLKKRIASFFDPAYFSVVEGDAEQVQKLLVLP